jgi:hypothetical protein
MLRHKKYKRKLFPVHQQFFFSPQGAETDGGVVEDKTFSYIIYVVYSGVLCALLRA